MDAVTQEQGTDAGRAARWLLLFCTLFGLGLMHTLGHLGMPMDVHPHTAAEAGAHAGVQPQAPGAVTAGLWPAQLRHEAVAAPCPDGHCDAPAHGGMGAWELCLTVLGGLTLALLLGAMLRRRAPAGTGRRRDGAGERRAGRGPPVRPAGLTVASAAVLRI